MDKYERSDVVEDRKIFLNKMEKFKPYIVEFEENSTMKPKVYAHNCTVRGEKQRSIIVITHNECTVVRRKVQT